MHILGKWRYHECVRLTDGCEHCQILQALAPYPHLVWRQRPSKCFVVRVTSASTLTLSWLSSAADSGGMVGAFRLGTEPGFSLKLRVIPMLLCSFVESSRQSSVKCALQIIDHFGLFKIRPSVTHKIHPFIAAR